MTLLNALEPLARPYIKNCPKALVLNEMRRAAREFCEKSQAWRSVAYIGFGATVATAAISLPAGQTLVGVVKMTKQGATKPLDYTQDPDSLSAVPGEPSAWSSKNIGTVQVGRVPTETLIYVTEIAVKPSLDGTELPDDVAEAWGEGIADGAVYNLLMMEGTEWYNPDRASFHKGRFDNKVTDARIKKATGFKSIGSSRATGQKFI
jgi:hypothetical protein